MNAVTNTGKRTGQRVIRQARSAFITAAVLLSLFLCSCSAEGKYHMELNGDSSLELEQNGQFADPGVTFFDENDNAVSAEKQAELEKEITVTGLDKFDPSVPGSYSIIYQYADQTLERIIEIPDIREGNTPPRIQTRMLENLLTTATA